MKAPLFAPILAAALSASCHSVDTGPAMPPALQSPIDAVERNPDAARLLADLRLRGLQVTPADASRVESLSDAPGMAYRVGEEWLHLHVYQDTAAAGAARQRMMGYVLSRSVIIDWVGRPHLFHCGSTLALYLGQSPQALNVLTSLCGPPTPLYPPAGP